MNGVENTVSDSIEKMYQEYLDGDMFYDGLIGGKPGSLAQYNASDGEDFFTSKEIVQQKEALEKRFGVSPSASRGGGTNGEIEEDVHFKRYTTKRIHKYTEKEKREIAESCVATIVHDYGEFDIYHLSDEERAKNDMLAEIRLSLATLKKTYRRVDQYVEAMRIVMKAWEILEKNNYIHTKDEFYKLVAEGKIYSTSIIMPKLKRIDDYNMDMIIKYISNPDADASELAPVQQEVKDPWYDQFMLEDDEEYRKYFDEYIEGLTDEDKEGKEIEDIQEDADMYARTKIGEENMKRLLSPDEVEFVLANADHPPKIPVKDVKRAFIKDYDRIRFGRSNSKKWNKRDRPYVETLHNILNKIQNNPEFRKFANTYDHSSFITQSMFDTEKPFKDFMEDFRFDGSWASDDDVFLYFLAMREEILKQHPAGQGYRTYGDQELVAFFKILEDHGINTLELRRKMNMSSSSSVGDDINAEAKRKENKKLEAAIVQRITKLNGNPKFKKLVSKAEKALNKKFEEG